MRSSVKIGIVLIMLLSSLTFYPVFSQAPSSQTVSISDDQDDFFVTEIGVGFNSPLVTILDPNMDIRALLVFRDIEINFWNSIDNATLRLRTGNTLSFDNDSSVTIYGVKESDFNGYGAPSSVLSAPLTTAHVNYNTSQFYGDVTHEIDVTEIVDELKSDPYWDGDGYTPGTGDTDHMGFIILGAEGHETRYFIDYSSGSGQEAELEIHWDHSLPPPPGYPGADYNETYRDLDIWSINASEVGWINYGNYNFYDISGGEALQIVSDTELIGTAIRAGSSDDFRLHRSNPSNTDFVLMSINISDVQDANGASKMNPAHLFGHANANKSVFDIDNDLNSGVFLTITTPTNNTDQIFAFAITTHKAGLYNRIYGTEYNITRDRDRYFLNISYDYPNKDFIVSVYNDSGFSNLLETVSRVGYANILTGYGHEYAFNTESRATYSDRVSFNTLVTGGITWIGTDENGTVIVESDSYDDILIQIDDYLDPDPLDPDPPSEGWDPTGPFARFRVRFYIFILGVVMFWGPLTVWAYQRPTGYQFVIGAFIMLVGCAFMVAAGSV
jgi:hypothetical protein